MKSLYIKVKAVIFDLDDTLLNRSKAFEYYCIHLIEKYFPKSIKNDKNIIAKIKEMDKNSYESRDTFYKNIIDKWNLDHSIKELEDNWFENFDKFSIAEDFSIDILDYLFRKYKLGIITNGSNSMQNRKIDALGIQKYFQEIIISSDVGIKKPDKEIFLLTCKKLGILPSNCLFVGDNFEIDIIGANNAGIIGLWYNKFNIESDYMNRINKLESIMDIL